MHVNRKWTFYILERWFRPDFKSNFLYKSKEAKQYKFYIVEGYLEGKDATSGWRPSPKNAFAKAP